MLLAEKHIKVVLIVPSGKEDFFKQQYAGKAVVQPVDSRLILKNGLIKAFRTMGYLLVDSHYLWYKKVERRNANRAHPGAHFKYFLERVFTKVCAGRKNIRHLYRRMYMQHTAVNDIERLFDAYKPDLLFATDIFDETDGLFIRQAKHTNVPSVGMVRSWDNCYSKGILKAIPDTVIVNNETIKRELVDIHGVDEDTICPVGVPQYDHLFKILKLKREEFLQSIGARAEDKLIVFAPAGRKLFDKDTEFCEILSDAIERGEIKGSAHVLIRNHPGHPANLDIWNKRSHFTIENPGRTFDGLTSRETELTNDDSVHLANTLYHADLIIYVATTMGLDSLVFDKPQIIVNFDGYKERFYTQSIRRYHDEDHMKKMLSLGGVRRADSKEDLINAMNIYLENPSLDNKGREHMRKQQLYLNDGHAAERIAKHILSRVF